MSVFNFARNRDAWATIRGFVYQVDVTIERWLELKSDEVLELERGEDIDTIRRAVDNGSSGKPEELLEQVKVRENNLTLRSESALSALASFHEHKTGNPQIRLQFRYLTNAEIGEERKLPRPADAPLIAAWQNIWEGADEEKNAQYYLQSFRELIKSAAKPSDFNNKTWKSFKKFIRSSSDAKFLEFVKSVEWSTGQAEPHEIADLLQSKIIEKYKVSEKQSVSVYQRLFHHVFRVISKSGVKRLTASEITPLLETPNFAEKDAVDKLFEQLESYDIRIKILETGQEKIRQDVGSLKVQVEEQNYLVEPDFADLSKAFEKVSRKYAAQIVDKQKTVARPKFDGELDCFFTESVRYALAIGISGAGKSIAVASQAIKLIENGWTVLLLSVPPGEAFNFADFAAGQIKAQLSPEPRKLEWSQTIKPWLDDTKPSESKGLVIILDGLEASDPENIGKELNLLHNSLGDVSPQQVKIILSCRNFDFQQFINKFLPFLTESHNWRQSNRSYKLLEIGDFTSDELDAALLQIGASDLLSLRNETNERDSHILSLRDLLKHPGTFEHFANLYERGDIRSIHEETWSSLIGRRIEYVLQDISRQSGKDVEKIRENLSYFTEICRLQKSREFSLSFNALKTDFADWFVSSAENEKTFYSILIGSGMLFEQTVSSTEKYVSFRITDAGAYLLSFILEREIQETSSENLSQLFKDYLSEAWQFSPMLDALLAFVDRKCVYPYSDRILALLKAIAESHQYQSLFSLMRPTVLGAVFKLIRQNPAEEKYDYFDAARLIRFSVENIPLLRRNLASGNLHVRRLAAEMTGIYKLGELSEQLTKLLTDEEDVHRATYRAFGKIGKSGVDALLIEIKKPENSVEFKSSCIYALSNIGFFNQEISDALSDVFSQVLKTNEKSLIRASLLASAQLRDPNQIQSAKHFLSSDNRDLALAAAKYLTEIPAASSWDKLLETLHAVVNSDSYETSFHSYSLVNQIIAALLKINREKAESELYELVREGVSENGKLGLMQSERLVKIHDLAFGYPLILDRLLKEIQSPPPQNFAHSLSEMLGSTWQPDALKSLIDKTEKLKVADVSVSEIFVNAIAPNMQVHDEFPMAEGLNRVSDLDTLIKCQAADFVSKVQPLFKDAPELSTRQFCRYFWLIGDPAIEDALILKFEKSSEGEKQWHTRNKILKALGTCGTKRGADFVLSYLKTDADVSLAFPTETLFPLLHRKIISPDKLATFCRNKENNRVGRAVCLFALADFAAPQFLDLFVESIGDEDSMVQRNALISLGFIKSKSAVAPLRNFLSSESSHGLKSYAARALMRLNAVEAVADIEDAFEDGEENQNNDLATEGFLDALAHFRSASSLPIIFNRLASAAGQNRGYYLEALGSFLGHSEAEQKLFQELEQSAENSNDFFGEQSQLVSGITFEWNEKFFKKILNYLENNRLSESSRTALCRNLPRIFKKQNSDKNIILNIIKILLADYNLDVRDRALNTLTLLPKEFCEKIYQEMSNTSGISEWTRACAVESLGYWESDAGEINKVLFENELLVRRAANKAIQQKTKLKNLKYHLSEFQNENGLARTSAFLCLADNGNLSSIWKLYETENTKSLTFTYTDNLIHEISEKRRKDIQESQRNQEKEQNERGTIYFD